MNDAHVFSNVFSTLFDALNAISNCFLTTTTLGVANNRLSLGIKRESIEPYYKTYTDLSLDDIMFFYFDINFINKFKNTGEVTISLSFYSRAGRRPTILLTTQDLLNLGLLDLDDTQFGDED